MEQFGIEIIFKSNSYHLNGREFTCPMECTKNGRESITIDPVLFIDFRAPNFTVNNGYFSYEYLLNEIYEFNFYRLNCE